jgi:hypothetical protein
VGGSVLDAVLILLFSFLHHATLYLLHTTFTRTPTDGGAAATCYVPIYHTLMSTM